jgi:hypothetical protein
MMFGVLPNLALEEGDERLPQILNPQNTFVRLSLK